MRTIVGLLVGVAIGWQMHGEPHRRERQLVQIDKVSMLDPKAASSWLKLKRKAKADGVPLRESSTYRTRQQQLECWMRWKAGTGPRAAPPGKSMHEVGLAVDVHMAGETSPEYIWLAENAESFGFYRTVSDEPWHWEFKENT
jgi:LAS superfamily LD-carboxypeptidase LdcB